MRAEQTIVSTCLPTIASEFEANQAEYTWVSVTYMLTQTAFQPLYGKLSDLIGRTVRLSPRRPWREYVLMRAQSVLYGSIFIFAAGSVLCGSAQVRLQ